MKRKDRIPSALNILLERGYKATNQYFLPEMRQPEDCNIFICLNSYLKKVMCI